MSDEKVKSETDGAHVGTILSHMASSTLRFIAKGPILMWKWSVIYRSANRKIDPTYASVWNTPIDDDSVRDVLSRFLRVNDQDKLELPTDEESIRYLIQQQISSSSTVTPDIGSTEPSAEDPIDEFDTDPFEKGDHTARETESTTSSQKSRSEDVDEKGTSAPSDSDSTATATEKTAKTNHQQLPSGPEETWEEVPQDLRNLLAAMNAQHIEDQLEILVNEDYHTKSGLAAIRRYKAGTHKTFLMWRKGFTAGVGRPEKYFVNFFFIPLLAFFACYPDIAAGFLGQRTYNLRSVGSKLASLFQLASLTMFPYHSFWLLFNWSLERIIGAFVGNTIYALSAIIPKLRMLENRNWFRLMVLGLSMSWQICIQFTPAARNYLMRHVVRRQTHGLRGKDGDDPEKGSWVAADKAIQHQLVSSKLFLEQQRERDWENSSTKPVQWQDVPCKTRVERFIFYTRTYNLGRPTDQLVGLLKEELEGVVDTYEDYAIGAQLKDTDKGHVEPRMPKFFLVFFDMAIFAYVCYSFWSQPFTFNTTVAYGTVCVIKQAILAFKKYQTVVGARRVFTNMVAFNLLGVFLVSTPVTAQPGILESNLNFALLLSSMVFATLFLAEPIAPGAIRLVEWICRSWNRMKERRQRRKIAKSSA